MFVFPAIWGFFEMWVPLHPCLSRIFIHKASIWGIPIYGNLDLLDLLMSLHSATRLRAEPCFPWCSLAVDLWNFHWRCPLPERYMTCVFLCKLPKTKQSWSVLNLFFIFRLSLVPLLWTHANNCFQTLPSIAFLRCLRCGQDKIENATFPFRIRVSHGHDMIARHVHQLVKTRLQVVPSEPGEESV